MPQARPRASLIYNPNAGRRRHGRTIEGIKAALGDAYDLSVTPTSGPKHAISLARDAARRGDAAVFAWGGDGTIREVVEGILGSPVLLGVLPGGTFNVVALAVGTPKDPIAAAAALARARPSGRDVGLIGSTPFVMQATAGLDAFAMHHLTAESKARFGILGAVGDVVGAFRKYRFPWFEVEVDGKPYRVTGAGFVNVPEYAGRFRLAPEARWDDRKGNVILYTGSSHLQAFGFHLSLALGRHHLRRDVVILEAAELRILDSPSLHMQTDGDPWSGPFPVSCRLAPDQIQVLIPDGK